MDDGHQRWPTVVVRLLAVATSPWSRLTLFVVLLGVLAWLAVVHGTSTVELARDWTAELGAAGAAAFVVVYALATMSLVPAAVLSTTVGVLYGPVAGLGVVWAGAMLGASGCFALGRGLSRQAVEQLAGDRLDRLNEFLARRGVLAVLLVRLVPLFPFGVVNYASAVTGITFRQYFLGTAVGILPGSAAYVWLGGSLWEPTSPAFVAAVSLLLVLAIVGGVMARRVSRRKVGQGRS